MDFQEFDLLINAIKVEILKEINGWYPIKINKKDDGTSVTNIDIEINKIISKKLVGFKIISEENVENNLSFPSFVIDPVDGTKELIKDNNQWSISIAYLNSKKLDENCYGEVINIHDLNLNSIDIKSHEILVSNSEFNKGLYASYESNFKAIGSIAYKLKLLSAGKGKGVVTLRPKSIWDIAAGTILLRKMGFVFYENGHEVKELAKIRFTPPMIWCRQEDLNYFKKII